MGIQRDQFSVENEVALERHESLHYAREAPIEDLLWRENSVTSPALHGNAAIAIEFDLKAPLLARRQRRDRLALHRFNERRFRALRNCLVLRRLCHRSLISLGKPN